MFLPVVIVCFQGFFSKLFGSWNHIKKKGKVCQIQTLVKTEKTYPAPKDTDAGWTEEHKSTTRITWEQDEINH